MVSQNNIRTIEDVRKIFPKADEITGEGGVFHVRIGKKTLTVRSGEETRFMTRKGHTPDEWRAGKVSDSTKLRMLESMEPIEVDSLALGDTKDIKELRIKAKEIYRTLKNAVNKHDGRDIQFSMRAYDEIESHSGDARVLMIVPKLKALMENAVPIFDEKNTKPLKRNIVAWHQYAVKTIMNGNIGFVRLTTHEDAGGKIFLNFFTMRTTQKET